MCDLLNSRGGLDLLCHFLSVCAWLLRSRFLSVVVAPCAKNGEVDWEQEREIAWLLVPAYEGTRLSVLC